LVVFFDVDGNNYSAAYANNSATMYEGACNISYSFALNYVTLPGMYKMLRISPPLLLCPPMFPNKTNCGAGYWLAVSVTGSFAFIDTTFDEWCFSFLALADPSTTVTAGTFTTPAKSYYAHGPSSISAGFNGTYNTTAASISINFNGCPATFALDPSSIQTPGSPQSFVNIIPHTKAATPFKVSGASRRQGGMVGWALRAILLALFLCAHFSARLP
jgi:hypothetical protein